MNEGYSMKKWIILKSKEKEKYVAPQRVYQTKKEGIFKSSAKQTDTFTILNFTTQ